MTERERELADRSTSAGRRGFMVGAGSLAGIAMLGSAAGSKGGFGDEMGAAGDVDKPLPYSHIEDVEALKSLGRDNYHAGMHCGQGCFDAIISTLRNEVGEPYTEIPTTATYWSAGGGSGWSAVCGAVVGANTAISLVMGDTGKTMKLVDELQRWYTQHKFPMFTPEGGEKLPTSRSGSILCHTSVTNWCKSSGYASGSSKRSERCSRLTGEVAAKAVELLNAEAKGNFEEVELASDPPSVSSSTGCRSCHFKGSDFDHGQYTRGKMECMQCHGGAPHMPESLKP